MRGIARSHGRLCWAAMLLHVIEVTMVVGTGRSHHSLVGPTVRALEYAKTLARMGRSTRAMIRVA